MSGKWKVALPFGTECAVIGFKMSERANSFGWWLLNQGDEIEHYQLEQEIIKLVRHQIGQLLH
jgi:hypothetical protein